jgi:hypothetical protein
MRRTPSTSPTCAIAHNFRNVRLRHSAPPQPHGTSPMAANEPAICSSITLRARRTRVSGCAREVSYLMRQCHSMPAYEGLC